MQNEIVLDKAQRLIQIRKELFTETFSNAQLKDMNLTDQQSIIQKQRDRLNVKHPRVTLDQLGLSAIKNGDNLYNMIKQRKIKIIKAESNGMSQYRIIVAAIRPLTITLEKGTLLFPAERSLSTQTLIIRDDLRAQISTGQSQLIIKTFCFNKQLRAPVRQKYYLGSIRSIVFNEYQKIDQAQTWEIYVIKKQQLKGIQLKYEKKDYIAFTKAQIIQLMNIWDDDQ